MTRSALAHSIPSVAPSGDLYTHAGTLVPEGDLRARHIARQAGHWRAFAAEHSRMQPATLDAKALGACAFSVHHRAASFAVPSKLVGTSHHQRALRALSRDVDASWLALDLDARGEHLVVLHRGRVLGRVQPKHLGWVRPLVPFGLALYLSRVTGSGEGRARSGAFYRLGCNVAFGHVGAALAMRTGVAHGGDGAHDPSPLRLVVAGETRAQSTPKLVGVPILHGREALSGDSDDVILWRTRDGEARASVAHAAQHSPTGIEWGYGGSGPADLARSILLALVGERAADVLYQRFKHEVVAAVPEAGGVLRAADVRAWTRAQAA